jgi:uncharacterized OB-fold protein
MIDIVMDNTKNNEVYGFINELLEGSGVFCEYCNAEVHPDCEICPSCGHNISEWIDDDE